MCKEHDTPVTRAVNSSDYLDVAMKHIREELVRKIQQIRGTDKSELPRKKAKQVHHNTLDNYFTHATSGNASSEMEGFLTFLKFEHGLIDTARRD